MSERISCLNPGKLLSYPALAACTNGCTRSNLEIKAENKCANHVHVAPMPMYDGREQAAANAERADARPYVIRPVSVLPCRTELCFDRCVNEKSSRTEMRMRELVHRPLVRSMKAVYSMG